MFDDNSQDQKQPDAAQSATPPVQPPAPPAGGTLGFSGNAIDNAASLATSMTPLVGSPPAVTPDGVSQPADNNSPVPATPPLMSNDSGISLPEPHIGSDAASAAPTAPEPPDLTAPDVDTQAAPAPDVNTEPAPDSSADENPVADSPEDDSSPTGENSEEPNFDLPEIPADTGSDDDDTPADDTPPEPPDEDSGTEDNDSDSPAPEVSTEKLENIKQQALQQLSPLVSHLDQTPEEKFHTTMMMIQATDDESLIPQAYTTAQQIQDEKAKAQALLELINEVNYFTQRASKPSENAA